MKIIPDLSEADWSVLCARPALDTEKLTAQVSDIIEAVKEEGDSAIRRFTAMHDKVELEQLRVSKEEIEAASTRLSDDLKEAILVAKENILRFHESQWEESKKIETMPGVTCWRKSLPIESVGLYIPGGSAPLFSTVLMLGVPALIAGCKEVVLCSPPGRDGSLHPAILFAAKVAGIDSIFKAGGAQAIAGMAYGTASIPAVRKIFGPGNQYVTRAKQLVNTAGVAIDLPAGPSEVLVFADETANPSFIAADLLSQAEHGADSQVVLVAHSKEMVDQTLSAIDQQIQDLPRKTIAALALDNSLAVLAKDREEAAEFINEYAPEHLILAMDDAEQFSDKIQNAGSVFLGHFTPESVGDYASGTNHTLPTGGFAKAYSGVSLDSYIKKITFQKLSPTGLQSLGPRVEKMAAAEELDAHKNAVTVRLKTL